MSITRRDAIARYGALLAASPLVHSQQPSPHAAPLQELVNAFEFEVAARRKLGVEPFEEIAGGERTPFDRITFRPRMMVNTSKLDLTSELLGQTMFAPILVGPTSNQKRFHPDGELAMARGASAAKATMIVSSRSSYPIDQLASQAKGILWYQVYPEPDMLSRAQEAVKCGCKAVCMTVGASKEAGVDWKVIDRLRATIGVPFVIKGVVSPEEARSAIKRGVQGIVVSNYNGRAVNAAIPPMEVLPAIVDAVAGAAPVLIDGGFRRGSDILKALALGASGVLLGRPALWGLAAYGAEGVQRLLEMLQTELARDMAMCGRPTLKSLDRTLVKVHRA